MIVITLQEIYAQCARAPLRAGLWQRNDRDAVPSMGDILAEMTNGKEGGADFDKNFKALNQTDFGRRDYIRAYQLHVDGSVTTGQRRLAHCL